MKTLFRMIVLMIVLSGIPTSGDGKTRTALLSLHPVDIAPEENQKIEQFLVKAVQKYKFLEGVPPEIVKKSLEQEMTKILKTETALAREKYYHMQFEEAMDLLEGREDEEALKWLALFYQAEGRESEMKNMLVKLLVLNPHEEISEKDYPPRLVQAFQETKKKFSSLKLEPSKASIVQLNSRIRMNPDRLESWHRRFATLGKEKLWDQMVISLFVRIGWNYKLTLYLFPASQRRSRKFQKWSSELIDLQQIKTAVKMLVDRAFIVDTSSSNR